MVQRLMGFLLLAASAWAQAPLPTIINGTPVPAGQFKEVINIKSGGGSCTASVVGPRVILTAAHCAKTDAKVFFTLGGVQYEATMTRSGIYPGQDHDIALGITPNVIAGITPATIGGKANQGDEITLLGFGCINPGGTGGNDGILRMGNSIITGFSSFDMISKTPGGAALCYGDSGGPAYKKEAGKLVQLGVNSKGDIKETNYNTRLDMPESQNFLKNFAQTKAVEICGINKTCGGDIPPPEEPRCTLTAAPSTIKLGQNVTISLVSTGNVTAAEIDGAPTTVPNGTRVITPLTLGTFASNGKVTGPGGVGTCQTNYTVTNDEPPPPIDIPTCTVTATPKQIKIGEKTTLEIRTKGNADYASIDGTPVALPIGKKEVVGSSKGDFSVNGFVRGPKGSSNCWTDYRVNDGSEPPPPTPDFAVVPAYCGNNSMPESGVLSVCLSVLKKSEETSLEFGYVVHLKYADGTNEIMPIAGRRGLPPLAGDGQSREELFLYANASLQASGFVVLDTKKAVLTTISGRSREQIPVAIEGRSSTGKYFIVEQLSPGTVHLALW